MTPHSVHFNALILAGGRSSRLGGVPKQHLLFHGRSLLHAALAAGSGAARIVVVGPVTEPLPEGVLSCREQPEFAGPAAAIAAGLEALAQAGPGAGYTLVLACDMPRVAGAVAVLEAALESHGGEDPGRAAGDGVMACSEDGASQPLAGFYRTDVLQRSAGELAASGRLVNGSVRSLLARLDVQLVTVPGGSTADVDTWDDAAALGIDAGGLDRDPNRRSRS